jgi:hypothetical protein
MISVVIENGVKNSSHVLDHYGPRTSLRDNANRGWKQVSVIFSSELLTRYRKRRARQAPGNDINATITGRIEFPDVGLDNCPARAV